MSRYVGTTDLAAATGGSVAGAASRDGPRDGSGMGAPGVTAALAGPGTPISHEQEAAAGSGRGAQSGDSAPQQQGAGASPDSPGIVPPTAGGTSQTAAPSTGALSRKETRASAIAAATTVRVPLRFAMRSTHRSGPRRPRRGPACARSYGRPRSASRASRGVRLAGPRAGSDASPVIGPAPVRLKRGSEVRRRVAAPLSRPEKIAGGP